MNQHFCNRQLPFAIKQDRRPEGRLMQISVYPLFVINLDSLYIRTMTLICTVCCKFYVHGRACPCADVALC